MTRISGYDLLACPRCGHVHRKTSYSSVSVYVPDDLKTSNDKACVSCRESSALEDFKKVGYLSRFTPEQEVERYAWTLYSIGQGPRPLYKRAEAFHVRFWMAIKVFFIQKPKLPWEAYPPLG